MSPREWVDDAISLYEKRHMQYDAGYQALVCLRDALTDEEEPVKASKEPSLNDDWEKLLSKVQKDE